MNLLVILADQLRRHALSCQGDPDVRTPAIDRLAAEGVRFAAACSTCPVCVPYRFTFMTGQSANSRSVPCIEWRMSPAERTIADEFNEAGFQTMYLGKWHLYGGHALLPGHTEVKANRTPVPRAYQGRWRAWRAFEVANDFWNGCWFADDDPTPRRFGKHQTEGLTDLAIATLAGRDRSRPFACVVSYEAPHPPMQVPEPHAARWRERELTLPPNFATGGDRERLLETVTEAGRFRLDESPEKRAKLLADRRIYGAMVEHLDEHVGRLLAWLEAEGLAEDTVVAFTADHGDLGGAHFAAGKEKPYEESVGVPLIVRDPRLRRRAGAVVAEPTCSEDLYPTWLSLCGLPARAGLPGRDLSPLLRDDRADLGRDGVVLELVAELRHRMLFHAQT